MKHEYSYKINYQDYENVYINNFKKNYLRKNIVDFIFHLLPIGVLLYLLTSLNDNNLKLYIVIVSGIYLIWFFNKVLFAERKYKKIINNTIKDKKESEVVFTINKDGISWKTQYTEIMNNWKCFDRLEDINEYFILITNGNAFFIIPKRIFKNEDDRNNFKEIILKYLQNVA
jgi:hypothetical protein